VQDVAREVRHSRLGLTHRLNELTRGVCRHVAHRTVAVLLDERMEHENNQLVEFGCSHPDIMRRLFVREAAGRAQRSRAQYLGRSFACRLKVRRSAARLVTPHQGRSSLSAVAVSAALAIFCAAVLPLSSMRATVGASSICVALRRQPTTLSHGFDLPAELVTIGCACSSNDRDGSGIRTACACTRRFGRRSNPDRLGRWPKCRVISPANCQTSARSVLLNESRRIVIRPSLRASGFARAGSHGGPRATLHVRRVKNGSPSTHPVKGDEMRAERSAIWPVSSRCGAWNARRVAGAVAKTSSASSACPGRVPGLPTG
jgi:hypothetical protein